MFCRPLFHASDTGQASARTVAWSGCLIVFLGCTPHDKSQGRNATPQGPDRAACTATSWWLDADGDGFGAGAPIEACVPTDDRYVQRADDCDDSAPTIHPDAIEADLEACQDGVDNDCAGGTDCDDPSCAAACTEDCTDGVDNDFDGFTDCEDADCRADSACEEDCTDGADNDLDGFTDCADTDCSHEATCPEDCTNGLDDDADGLIDCEDAECSENVACQEDCTNGLDDDADGHTDCDDDDCWGAPSCISPTVGVTTGHLRYATRSASSVPFSTSRQLVVDSASGWISTYQSARGWQRCGWSVQPWSTAFLVSSTGGELFSPRRGTVAFTGSCAAAESALPPQLLVFAGRGLPIYGYGLSASAVWYTGRTTASWTTGTFSTALWRGVDLSPSDTWVGR